MEISAHLLSAAGGHALEVRTGESMQRLAVAAKAGGRGSAVNGGEFLMAALASCYCNDLYREAARLGIQVIGCEVVASARFNGVGLAADSVTYAARVDSPDAPERIDLLLEETDRLAEIHNTLRAGCPVRRVAWQDDAG